MGKFTKAQIWIMIAIFVISIILTIVGQRHIGYAGLTLEAVGVAGVLTVLYLYNRAYK